MDSTTVPGETRRMLRDRLQRFLPTGATPVGQPRRPLRPPLSDSQVVELLSTLQFVAGSDIETAKAIYSQASLVQIAQETMVPEPASSRSPAQSSAAAVTASPPVPDVSQPVPSVRIIPPPPPNFEKLSPPPHLSSWCNRVGSAFPGVASQCRALS